MLKPIYVKMPITVAEKHEYHRNGFRVIDERFKPVDVEDATTLADDKPRRRRRNTVEHED